MERETFRVRINADALNKRYIFSNVEGLEAFADAPSALRY